MMSGRVTVCGLGPGGSAQITEATAEVLAGPLPKFLRTSRHPTAARALDAQTFDRVYESSDSIDDVYRTIAETVTAAAAAEGHVAYVVPGSPLVLERSVRWLRDVPDLDVELLPAISFLDEVWARLKVDPVDSAVRMIDGHRFATDAAGERGPLLVAHAHAKWVLSDIKLALDAGPEQSVVVMQRLGTPDEKIFEVPWPELDRSFEADHLTTLFLPEMMAPVSHQLARSVEMMKRLRRECPWDREQTHDSLRKYLIEETYEVVDAIDAVTTASIDSGADGGVDGGVDSGPGEAYADLEEELGDLWFQILFHAELAEEQGWFTLADVAQNLTDKMVTRHPHVYGDSDAVDGSNVETWERLKQEEKNRTSVLDGIPRSLPALALAEKTLKRVDRAKAVETDLGELGAALAPFIPSDIDEQAIGRLLLAVVELARQAGTSPELALRAAVDNAATRYRAAESQDQPDPRWVLG